MTLQEHRAILAFLDQAAGGTQEPLDLEADAIIRAYFKRNPDAAYRVTKFAMSLISPQTAEPEKNEHKRWRWLPALIDRGV